MIDEETKKLKLYTRFFIKKNIVIGYISGIIT